MVKQLSEGGIKGSAEVSITLERNGPQPPCKRAKGPGEMVLDGYYGFFIGAKQNLAFFEDDGGNGATAVTTYDSRTGKQVYSDNADFPMSEDGRSKDIRITHVDDNQVVLSYRRIVVAECSLPGDGTTCWEQIRKDLGIGDKPIPQCTGYGYEDWARDQAVKACREQNTETVACIDREIKQTREDMKSCPSVISYPVEVSLFPKPVVKSVAGPIECWPVQ